MFRGTAPAFVTGILFATIAGGGVTYASAHDGHDGSKTITKYASIKSATSSYDASGVELDLDEDGYVDAIAAYAECPSGTQMTGGGVTDYTSTGYLITSSPDTDGYEAWFTAIGIDEDYVEDPDDVYSTVTCWSAKGRPPGGYRRTTDAQHNKVPARIVRELSANFNPRG